MKKLQGFYIVDDDKIVFPKQKCRGEIVHRTTGYYYIRMHVYSNDYLFRLSNISNPLKYCSKIIGYQPLMGQFPEVRSKKDLFIILDSLFDNTLPTIF